MVFGLSLAAGPIAFSDARPGAFVSVPVTFLDAAGKPVAAERGLFLAPEKPEARWLGDINDFYHNTRELTPTPTVNDEFRGDSQIDVRVLLINGDLDWSTPIETQHLRRHLKRGHLVSVAGGTHRTVPGIELELMPIPAGQFVMGSPADEPGRETDEEPQTRVTISKPFWLGRVEVTHRQWRALMGTDLEATAAEIFADQTIYDTGKRRVRTLQMNVEDGGDVSGPEVLLGDTGDSVPMYLVSWVDAMAFCEALNKRERAAGRLPAGYVYRLPTDAEWEYAARAGTAGAIYRGTLEILGESTAPALDPLAWYAGNSTVGYTGRGFNVAAYRAERQYRF